MAYVQKNHPFPVTSCGRRRSFMTTDSPIQVYKNSPLERKKSNEPRKTTKGKNRNLAGPTAPADGLYLERVKYPENLLDDTWPIIYDSQLYN